MSGEYRRLWSDSDDIRDFPSRIGRETFDRWYRKHRMRQNIRNGTPYFNRPSTVTEPRKLAPSHLLTCHRKVYYRQLNAPRETHPPRGIFWFGSAVETDIVVPYLEWISPSDRYVQNSIWIDVTLETSSGEVSIRGETDPAIVDRGGRPDLLTEVKSVNDLDTVEEPRRHHRAQLSAYLHALESEWDRSVTGTIVYVDRTTLGIESHPITLNDSFWTNSVLPWITDHVQYRLEETLPPGAPEYPWECSYCPYRHRCGKTELPYEDLPPVGLLPDVDYPFDRLVEYLEAHDDEVVPPALIDRFPRILDRLEIDRWRCVGCGISHADSGVGTSHADTSAGMTGLICPTCSTKYRVPIPFRPPDEG